MVETVTLVHPLQWAKEFCFEDLIIKRDNLSMLTILSKGELDDYVEWGLVVKDIWFLYSFTHLFATFISLMLDMKLIKLPIDWQDMQERFNPINTGWRKFEILW